MDLYNVDNISSYKIIYNIYIKKFVKHCSRWMIGVNGSTLVTVNCIFCETPTPQVKIF